jgi:beta-N-acetylglucosaminidase
MYGNEPEEKEITQDEEVVMLPWDTAEKSILGGAVFIAERYVAAGQNTLYFQKFDVVPENGLYTRQYAQNIQMAWAEGLRYFSAYKAIGLADARFVFRIPFYRDMPSTPVALPAR